MSFYINDCTLLGNAGKDAEVKQVGDTKVATFTLATSRGGFKTRDGKDIPEVTTWHNIVAWRGLAEIAEKAIRKGTKVCVKGLIETRSYDGNDGQKKFITEIIANDIVVCDKVKAPESTTEQPPKSRYPGQDAFYQPPTYQDNNDLPF